MAVVPDAGESLRSEPMLAAEVAASTPAAPVAGEPATGGAAGFGSASTTGGPLWPMTYIKGTPIILDPASALYSAIGAGNLRAWSDSEAVGHAGLAN
jgi:hypothetical protein